MRILKQYNDDRRIVFKRHFFYGWGYFLQIKTWYGWKNVTHQYPSIMRDCSLEKLEHQLEYQEEQDRQSQYSIGVRAVNKMNL